MTTFEKLIAPLKTFFDEQGNQIDKKSRSKSLFFSVFTWKIVYAIVSGLPSMRMLLSDLETNSRAANLGFKPSPYSTFREGFSRFGAGHFREMFIHVLKSYDWMPVDAIDEVGIVKLVDGSLFPTLKSMCWASYKKSRNAIRLHLALDLNTMIPTEFIARKAYSPERNFLLSILEEGVTYVADRGYQEKKEGLEDLNQYFGISPEKWIKSIASTFYQHWKISAHWLLALKNLIDHVFDEHVIAKLAT